MRNITTNVCGGLAFAAAVMTAAPAWADVKVDKGVVSGTVKVYKKKGDAMPAFQQNLAGTVPYILNLQNLGNGLDDKTKVQLTLPANTPNGQWRWEAKAAGGNVVAWEDPNLEDLVTPTSEEAQATLALDGQLLGSQMLFTGSWLNSDAGVAQRVRWYDVTSPGSPSLLAELLWVGGGSGPIDQMISLPGGSMSNLMVEHDGIVTSIPEPASLGLLLIGGVATMMRRRGAWRLGSP